MSGPEAAPDTRFDAFLGGQLWIEQPVRGYRAGIDPVLLAASIPANPGETALDMGCGVGTAGLCLARRVPGVVVTGIEVQADYAALARANAGHNELPYSVLEADLSDPPKQLKDNRFHHILANPPYFDRSTRIAARDAGRETALSEATPLSAWVEMAAKRARPGGTVTFIHRAERLPNLLGHMHEYLGSLSVLPLIPRTGRPARLVLVRGIKGGRADFRLLSGWLLHEGAHHDGDRESYTKATGCILRDGHALPFAAKP